LRLRKKHRAFFYFVSLLAFLILPHLNYSANIDSLEKLLTKKDGREKVDLLNRLAEEYRNIDPEKTNAFAEQGLVEAKKLGYTEGEADAYHKKGIYYYFIDDYDKALVMYDKSLSISRKLDNKKLIAQVLSWIGSLHRVLGEHRKALEEYNQALLIAREINDKNRIVYCLRSIGDDYRMQQENDQALKFFNEAIKIAEEIGDLDQKAYILHTTGELYRLQADYTKAINSLNEAAVLSEKTKNYNLLSNELYSIGEVYLAKNDYAKALDYFDRALVVARNVKDKIRITDCYAAMGDVYRLEDDLEKARDFFNQALAVGKEINYQNTVAYCYMAISDIYTKKGQYEFAIEYLKRSTVIAENIGDKHRLSEVYSQLGEVYERKFDYKRSEENFRASLALAQEINNQSTIASSLVNLGEIARDRKNYREAIAYGEKGLKLAKEIDVAKNIVDATFLLYDAYKKTGEFKRSVEMLEMNKNMSDTLKARENSKKIFQQQIKFEYEEEKAKEKIALAKHEAEQEAKLKAQLIITWISVFGLLLVLGLAVVIFKSARKQKQANILLEKQNKQIEHQKQEITDSINYAQRIQTAIMPDKESFSSIFVNSFILYQPKDIVSGDFYYFQVQQTGTEKKSKPTYVVAVADCTGHGVPGAFMSMISYQKLEEAVSELYEPKNILKRLNKRIKTALKQTSVDSSSRDGLDIALLSCKKPNEHTLKIKFSGANRPLWIVRKVPSADGNAPKYEMEEVKVTKTSIGGFTEVSQEFLQHDYELKSGDTIYMSSDGFADQFGGEANKKMTTRKFKNLLLEIQANSMQDQYHLLMQYFSKWKGDNQQVDDILVIGIRV
jgi:tetratricopeptide (TPR) repeat protein